VPPHLIVLNLITQTMYRQLSSALFIFLHSPIIAYLLGLNIHLSTLFLNTLSPHSSLILSNQVSHPNKSMGKIIFLFILVFIFLDSKFEDKRFCTEWQQALPDCNMFSVSSWIEFWFIKADTHTACDCIIFTGL
jgi:hypothetical protein